MSPNDVTVFWQTTAKETLASAQSLVKAKHFDHALFFCHLALEKMLKGLVWKKTNNPPFPIHDLVKLAQQAHLQLSTNQQEQLKEITTWNIEARYDTYKRDFYRKATQPFTLEWMKTVKEIFIWIQNQY
ncbi:MAG: HEPN domain-containing protein [Patescibacteria group bacterium]|mgnify:CR=1 FL=1